MEEQDEEELKLEEERELRIAKEQLDACEMAWEEHKSEKREQELKVARSRLKRIDEKIGSTKREQGEAKGATRKKLKYSIL